MFEGHWSSVWSPGLALHAVQPLIERDQFCPPRASIVRGKDWEVGFAFRPWFTRQKSFNNSQIKHWGFLFHKWQCCIRNALECRRHLQKESQREKLGYLSTLISSFWKVKTLMFQLKGWKYKKTFTGKC